MARYSRDEIFRRIVEAAPDAVLAVDEAGRILLVNENFERVFGYRREEVLGRSVESLMSDRAGLVRRRHRERYFTDPRPRPMGTNLEVQARRKDGTLFPVEIFLSPTTTSQGLIVATTVRDVSDSKRLERDTRTQLQRQATLARLSLSALSGNEPDVLLEETLAPVAETLTADYVDVLEFLPESQRFRRRAGHGWRHATAAVEIDSGPRSLPGFVFETGETVVLEDLSSDSRFQVPPVLFEHRVASGVLVPLAASSFRFGVLAAYTTLRYRFRPDDVSFLESVGRMLAHAIDRDRSHRELYGELNECRTTLDEKTGALEQLNRNVRTPLNVVLGSVSLLRDHLEKRDDPTLKPLLETVERSGRKLFSVLENLPVRRLPRTSPRTTPEPGSSTDETERPEVLVVEDDPDTQRYMHTLLGQRYRVVLAADADEARDRLATGRDRVRMVLMDLSLRGSEDGLSLTREIRNRAEWEKVPIIAVTAHAFPEDRHSALAAGCNDFLAKPFERSALFSLMERHLKAAPPEPLPKQPDC